MTDAKPKRKPESPEQVAARQAKRRALLRAVDITEVRGIYAPIERHDEIKAVVLALVKPEAKS